MESFQPDFDLLIGGGPLDGLLMDELLVSAQRVIAADGGANHFKAFGRQEGEPFPDLIVGDMDSIVDLKAWERDPDVAVIVSDDQNSTDLDKALAHVRSDCAQIALGFTGGRFDQTLTTLSALVARGDLPIIFVGASDLFCCLPQGRSGWPSVPGERISLFPLGQCDFEATTGLRYPLSPLTLQLGGRLGTSNEATADYFEITYQGDPCLLLRPVDGLWRSIEAVCRQ